MVHLFPVLAGLGLFGVLLVLGCFAFWLWMLVDCLQKKFKDKLIWIIVLILLGPLGAFLYFFLVKNKK